MLLNHLNWTCTTQVMVHFSRLLHLRLLNGLCPDFGTVRGLVFSTEFRTIMWSIIACCLECFVGISMPQMVLRIKLSLLKFE